MTAGMLCSPSSCLHMLEALRRPASRSVFYINSAPELWKVDGFGRPLRADHATQVPCLFFVRLLGLHHVCIFTHTVSITVGGRIVGAWHAGVDVSQEIGAACRLLDAEPDGRER